MTNNEIRELRDQFITDAEYSIDRQIEILRTREEEVLNGADERDPQVVQYHLASIRGSIEGLELARYCIPTAHLFMNTDKAA